MTTSIIVGGSGGLGRVLARRFADRGDTVIITGRTRESAETAAAEIAGTVRGLVLDLSRPQTIDGALGDVAEVDNLVIGAMAEDFTTVSDFDIARAIHAVTLKLVGYTETVRVLRGRFNPGASVVLFGGLAKERPYPGSTMVSAINSGISGLVKTLAVEIAPHRVNAIHPGKVGDHPRWHGAPGGSEVPRTPIGRLVTMAEVADAVDFLLRNTGVNAQDLYVDGGVRLT